MSKKELQVAVLFQYGYEDDNISIAVPTRLLVGITDDLDLRFYDVLTQQYYYNFERTLYDDEVYAGFQSLKSLSYLKKKYSGMDTAYVLLNYFNEVRKNVYFFDDENMEECQLSHLSIEEFNKKYGLEFFYPNIPERLEDIDFDELEKQEKALNQEIEKEIEE